jgi:type I restriction enzyme S subunit
MREMKDSGVPWIGEIPKGWDKSAMKYIGKYINGYAFKPDDWSNKGLPIIRIQDLTGSNDNPNYFSGVIDDRYRVRPNDILISWAATLDAFIWKGPEGWLNQHIFKAIPNHDVVTTGFFLWLVKIGMLNMNNENKHGIVMQHVTASVFNNFRVPLPSLEEQRRIADFLDSKCAEIDSILEQTRASIEEYKKLKLSVITEAVTRGIRGERPMKDSGVEWIGAIPTGWDVLGFYRSNYIRGRLGWKGLKADEYVLEGYPFLSAFNIIENHLDWSELNFITQERYDESPEIKLSVGDLLIVKDGAGIGKCARIDELPLGEATVNSSLAVITASERFDYRYEYYYMQSAPFQHVIWFLKIGMGVPHLTQEKMREILIPCPTLDEQQEIAAYLDEKCAAIDSLIASKEALITELEAYKKSIIYEYVTGKKEVPAV